MAKTFRPYDPDQLLLMRPALADWVPEDHLARFVSDVVHTLTAIEETYIGGSGLPPLPLSAPMVEVWRTPK